MINLNHLTFALAGLTPAEYASLSWTHNGNFNCR